MSETRFFIDHGTIHDRVTGRHVFTGGDDEVRGETGTEFTLKLLNELVDSAGNAGEKLLNAALETDRLQRQLTAARAQVEEARRKALSDAIQDVRAYYTHGERAVVQHIAARMTGSAASTAAERARLDADRTADPKTKLVAHVPAGERIVGHSKVIDYELRDTAAAPVPEQDVERWAVEALEAIRVARPLLKYADSGAHYCRGVGCDAGTSNGWSHTLNCSSEEHNRAVDVARAAIDHAETFAPAPILATAQRKETP